MLGALWKVVSLFYIAFLLDNYLNSVPRIIPVSAVVRRISTVSHDLYQLVLLFLHAFTTLSVHRLDNASLTKFC